MTLRLVEAEVQDKLTKLLSIGEKIFETYRNQVVL